MFKLNMMDASEPLYEDKLYDVIIIGGGPAGLTAGIYTARDGWSTLILEKESTGGLAATTHLIENYPGFPEGIEGPELMERFDEQARRFGASIVEFNEVLSVSKDEDGIFTIVTSGENKYRGRTVLVATGSVPKKLGVPGEKEYYNKGVSYCATCDGPLFKDKDVVVVGCGNSGMQEAQILLEYAKTVTFVEYLSKSIAEKVLRDRVINHPKTECRLSHQLVEIKGSTKVESVLVKNRETGVIEEIPTDAVFFYIGYQPYTEFLRGAVELDKYGYIITDSYMQTSQDGIFAAGDVVANNLAQVAVAVGDGAKAAVAIREYLQSHPVPEKKVSAQ